MVVQGTAIATLSVMKSTELQLSSSQGMSHACCSWEKYLQLPLFGVMQDWVAPYHLHAQMPGRNKYCLSVGTN